MLCTASGVAFLEQIDGFIGICRDWAEVWIGLDGSAMGGRTTGSSWADRSPSRVITCHLEIFRAQFWMGGRLWNLHCSSVLRRKRTRDHTHQPRDRPCAGKGHMLLTVCEGCDGRAMQASLVTSW